MMQPAVSLLTSVTRALIQVELLMDSGSSGVLLSSLV